MSLELWNTFFAAGTFLVIAAAALAALIQLRHLQVGNQLNALLTLMEMWDDAEMQNHIKYMRTELQEKLKDPTFVARYRQAGVSRAEHPEMLVADYWEQIGTFMKYKLVDERPWLDAAAPQVIRAWRDLAPVIAASRERFGQAAFENFEYAAVRAHLWQERHPDGNYPTSTPRMGDLERVSAPRADR